ncbi:hypothetical protein LTR37_004062 [Vermiconidia calcicola]|uniref:Uncharacterized protein n=1 Tax=Vermiconidia calcicola TaxID=1690605 RepID=A0ACC3NPB5_9PEZI|nr:hypothetical protein LTR37_004062 [Vermiconidia calcicola]
MLPGEGPVTAPPHVIELDRLQKRFARMSRVISDLESNFLTVGLEWWALPREAVRELVSPSHAEPVNRTFGADGEQEAENTRAIGYLRCLRDQMRVALQQGNVESAQSTFQIAVDIEDRLEDDMIAVDYLVNRMKSTLDDRYQRHHYPDSGLPRSQAQQPDKWPLMCKWLLSLPDIRRAIETGFVTEDEAIEDALRDREQETIVHDPVDFDDSDVESVPELHLARQGSIHLALRLS